jgi:hypothetical protein
VHRSELRRRHHLGRRGIHRRRLRVHRDRHRHRRVRHGHRRAHRGHRRVHPDRRDAPNGPASHRDWGEGACCRGWGEDRPDLGWDARHRRRRLRGAGRRPDADRRRRAVDEARGARPERLSSRGCYRRAGHADRAWGRGPPDVSPVPGALPVGPPTQQLLPGPRERQGPGAAVQAGSAAGSVPERAARAWPSLRVQPGAVRRAWRRWTATTEPGPGWLHRSTRAPTGPAHGCRQALLLMVLPENVRLMMVLRRCRMERPSRGRTGVVAGPRGPLRSTTRI